MFKHYPKIIEQHKIYEGEQLKKICNEKCWMLKANIY